jgi:hypothetical protein
LVVLRIARALSSLRCVAWAAACICAALVLGCAPTVARAQSVGPHLGVNLDHGNVHLGLSVHVPIVNLSERVRLGLWPSYAHVFIHEGHDVELLGVDVPFEFRLERSLVTPFVAPGLGLAFYGETTLKLNAIGGAFFDVGHHLRPFTALALRFVRGTYVDLLAGLMVTF